jgi:2-C-methyl-D-erythritol 4-phosphate cytidylyltransferase
MSKIAVIVAGGSGLRMGNELPKQFLLLEGKPILLHSIDAFLQAYADISIRLVIPQHYIDYTKELLKNFGYSDDIKIIQGGETRFHSVKNGIGNAQSGDIIFVHDAVRCLVSKTLIQRCYEMASEKGSAIPVIPIRDSMRKVLNSEVSEVVSREHLYAVQTPQTFKSDILLDAFNVDFNPSFTDEATVCEHAGKTIYTVDGEEQNIKITYPEDLLYAKWRIGLSRS